ncbi:unnamed protein product [Polarella glacialis]|uniref:Uncharacterized protein n=1 Tax=Polarella glacialis TaxID=89957 RepID=A0A813HCK1_POLGL|nr:unnamed protein product [Polarella glacialis]
MDSGPQLKSCALYATPMARARLSESGKGEAMQPSKADKNDTNYSHNTEINRRALTLRQAPTGPSLRGHSHGTLHVELGA